MFIRNISDLMKDKNVKTYSCGSPPVHEYLASKNILPIYRYIHYINKKTIWVYIMCNDLKEALTEWSKNKPHKRR